MKLRKRYPTAARVRFMTCSALFLGLVAASGPAIAQICDPVISLGPPFTPADSIASVTVEVPAFRSISLFIEVSNVGCAPLDWKVRDVDPGTGLDCAWITESPDSGVVAPSGSQVVTARTQALSGGRYTTELWFASNDPVHPRLVLSITLVAVAPTEARHVTFGQLKKRFR